MKRLLTTSIATILLSSCLSYPGNVRYTYRERYCFGYYHVDDIYERESCFVDSGECVRWESKMRDNPHVYLVTEECELR